MIFRRYASQRGVVDEQGPAREVDRPRFRPSQAQLRRDIVVGQACALLVGFNRVLDVGGDPVLSVEETEWSTERTYKTLCSSWRQAVLLLILLLFLLPSDNVQHDLQH